MDCQKITKTTKQKELHLQKNTYVLVVLVVFYFTAFGMLVNKIPSEVNDSLEYI